MTSTSFNVGFDGTNRNSSKVLKPPGGGSSDIFGTAPVEQSPKRRTNHMQSSLFVEPESVNTTPARAKSGNDTHNRLFGEVTTKPVTPYSLKSKSNLGFGDELDNTPAANGKNIYSPREVRRNPVTGDGIESADGLNRNVRRRINKFLARTALLTFGEGTTTNGMKEASVANGNDNANESNNINANVNKETASAPAASAPAASAPAASTATSSPARAATAPQRSRVPPGGFSSGLW